MIVPLIGIAGSCLESLFAGSGNSASISGTSSGNTAGSHQAANQQSAFARILNHTSLAGQMPNVQNVGQAAGHGHFLQSHFNSPVAASRSVR